MRIDCHFHTSRHSACSLVSPERACELALARGLDALLITEHDRYWDKEALATLQAGFPGIKLYAGIEMVLAEGYHVVAVGRRLLRGVAPLLTLAQLEAMLQGCREDVFLFAAHAFRYDPRPLPTLPGVLSFCDGLEMNSINILRGHAVSNATRLQPDNQELYVRHLVEYRLTPVFNTDGHDEAVVGCIANQLDAAGPPGDEIALARLLKTSHPTEYQNRDLLGGHPLFAPRECPEPRDRTFHFSW